MSGMQAQTERNMLPKIGATFFRDDEGDVLFQFVVDSSNIIGPRPATRADQDKHPAAWGSFVAAEGVSALDRDASGESGGSLPSESPAVSVQAPVPHVPPEFDDAQVADPKVDEQDYKPGDIAGGPPMADLTAPIIADDLGGGAFVTKDGSEFQRLSDAADHALATETKPRRKYTRRPKG